MIPSSAYIYIGATSNVLEKVVIVNQNNSSIITVIIIVKWGLPRAMRGATILAGYVEMNW